MLIENKKDGRRVIVNETEWETLKDIGFAKSWTVIDKNEIGIKKLPEDILNIESWKPKKKKNGSK